jgi:hypothetical protein
MIKLLILIALCYPLYHMARIWWIINKWIIPIVLSMWLITLFSWVLIMS